MKQKCMFEKGQLEFHFLFIFRFFLLNSIFSSFSVTWQATIWIELSIKIEESKLISFRENICTKLFRDKFIVELVSETYW